jgi:DNA-binding protein Fis
MTPEQKFQKLFEEMYSICQECGWGDPFSYARSREIHMAGVLGHKIAQTYSGADAIDEDVEVEYKSTIAQSINGTYNGISVQDTWEEQERYIVEDKIGKYANHYFARYEGAKIVEIWKMNGNDVLAVLLPKIKKQYPLKKNGNSKDPRIGVTISTKEIKKYGVRIK